LSDTFTTEGTETEPLDPNIRAQLGKVQQESKRADDAELRAAAAERELAFAKAGVPDDARGAIFRRGYDGDLTPDAIKGEYDEAFGTTATTETEVPEAELESLRRTAAAGSGSVSGGSVDLKDAINSARNETEVMRLVGLNVPGATDRNGYQIAVPEID
jgi:hypothetical protein